MAYMIPATCDLARRPMSEQAVFEALRERLADEWMVFHSFDYISRDLNKKRWDGEIDFLLYHPQKGFLVIEVKGGPISHRDGQWYQEDRPTDPVEQAKRNKYAVMRLLQAELRRDVPLRFAHCVCFPGCTRQKVWPPEAQGIVLTGDMLHEIDAFAGRVIDDAPLPRHLSGSVTERDVMRVLSPVFEYGGRLFERIAAEEKQFFLFTEQQCALLDALENFTRLQIRGCAGSGKTVMAIKKAQRLAAHGKRVLLLCYNQLLAGQLRKAVRSQTNIKAAAFFEFCIEVMRLPAEKVDARRNDPRLYAEVLPKLLREYLSMTALSYDAVIVDEGQDFSPAAWDVIALLPHSEGCFYIFYDPDQNIYQKELCLPDFGIPPVILSKNCRNTRKIFEALTPYLSMDAAIMDTAPVGTDVHVRSGDMRAMLAEELERLVIAERVPPQGIVVLGAHALGNTSLGADPTAGRFRLVERDIRQGMGEIAYYTYMKYKGCEAKAVVLIDVDDKDPRWRDHNGIYTAMSRAMHQLIILHPA